jgi:hypothetical protein
MPGGICGTWPAFWLLGPNWPNNGEIDIIEGVNQGNTDFITLHTAAGCTINNSGSQPSSVPDYTNCNTANANGGLGVSTTNTQGYGTGSMLSAAACTLRNERRRQLIFGSSLETPFLPTSRPVILAQVVGALRW